MARDAGSGSLASAVDDVSPEDDTPSMTGSELPPVLGDSRPSVITEDVELRGELSFVGEVHFNGKFEGTLISEGPVNIGEQAVIVGSVEAPSVNVAGKVQGRIVAHGRAHLSREAYLDGNLEAEIVSLEEGATVTGEIKANMSNRDRPAFRDVFTKLKQK